MPPRRDTCRAARARWKLKLALLTLALLALPSGTCVEMAARVAINSFFGAVTPMLNTRLQEALLGAPPGAQPP